MATITNKRLTPKQRAERDADIATRAAARKADEIARYRADHIANAAARKIDVETKAIDGTAYMTLYTVANDLRTAGQPAQAVIVERLSRTVFEYQQARDSYDRELTRAADRVANLRREFESGYASRGVRIGGEDVAEMLGTYRAACEALSIAAYYAGYRVPALEGANATAANDKRAALSVRAEKLSPVEDGAVVFVVYRDDTPVRQEEVAEAASALRYVEPAEAKPWQAEHVAIAEAAYMTEDAAWLAVAALCGAWLY